MLETNSGGTSATSHWPDAFGLLTTGWTGATTFDGLWRNIASQAGWHFQSKEFDADAGLVYQYQRWLLPESSVFLSGAPMPDFMEPNYTFGLQAPQQVRDSTGRSFWDWTMEDLFGPMPGKPLVEGYHVIGYLIRTHPSINQCPSTAPSPGKAAELPGGGSKRYCKDNAASVSEFHPGASSCFREIVDCGTGTGGGAQCCYDGSGNLITAGWGAGTYDFASPTKCGQAGGGDECDKANKVDMWEHGSIDFNPFVSGGL